MGKEAESPHLAAVHDHEGGADAPHAVLAVAAMDAMVVRWGWAGGAGQGQHVQETSGRETSGRR